MIHVCNRHLVRRSTQRSVLLRPFTAGANSGDENAKNNIKPTGKSFLTNRIDTECPARPQRPEGKIIDRKLLYGGSVLAFFAATVTSVVVTAHQQNMGVIEFINKYILA